jgi:hypothetical protein
VTGAAQIVDLIRSACAAYAVSNCPALTDARPPTDRPVANAATFQFADGTRKIWVNPEAARTMGIAELRRVIFHEVAHARTWDEFGVAVRPHGREFRRVCASVALMRPFDCDSFDD